MRLDVGTCVIFPGFCLYSHTAHDGRAHGSRCARARRGARGARAPPRGASLSSARTPHAARPRARPLPRLTELKPRKVE